MKKQFRVLLVEDEVIIALHIKKQLVQIGLEVVDHVATGEKAVSSAYKNKPDIVLMDIGLPGGINGIEAAQKIKSKQNVCIVFITGYEDKDLKKRAIETSPLAFITKPFEPDLLKAIIENHYLQ